MPYPKRSIVLADRYQSLFSGEFPPFSGFCFLDRYADLLLNLNFRSPVYRIFVMIGFFIWRILLFYDIL